VRRSVAGAGVRQEMRMRVHGGGCGCAVATGVACVHSATAARRVYVRAGDGECMYRWGRPEQPQVQCGRYRARRAGGRRPRTGQAMLARIRGSGRAEWRQGAPSERVHDNASFRYSFFQSSAKASTP
jgi:hypothetical protein